MEKQNSYAVYGWLTDHFNTASYRIPLFISAKMQELRLGLADLEYVLAKGQYSWVDAQYGGFHFAKRALSFDEGVLEVVCWYDPAKSLVEIINLIKL